MIRRMWSVPLTLILASGVVACDDEGEDDGAGGASSTSTTGSTTSSSSGGDGGAGGAPGTGGAGGAGGAEQEAFTITFRAQVEDATFDCADSYTLGTADTDVNLTDFRLYVHGVRLITSADDEVPLTLDQDGLWQHEGLALLDFEDRTGSCANGTTATNVTVRGTAPPGDYVGLAFELGVPAALNHLDSAAAPSPLNLTAMFWTWTSGYKFLRVDSVPAGGGSPFNLHLGATGCTGDPELDEDVVCTRPNRPTITFAAFDAASDVIVVDYAAAVAGSDLSTDGGGAPGCMSGNTDPECAPIFPLLGVDLDTGASDPAEQALFRLAE